MKEGWDGRMGSEGRRGREDGKGDKKGESRGREEGEEGEKV